MARGPFLLKWRSPLTRKHYELCHSSSPPQSSLEFFCPKERKNQEIAHPAMISILAQERLLGATLGAVFGGGVVFHQRRQIYKSLHENDSSSYEPVKITSERTSLNVAHAWNKGVDLTLGRFVEFLSSRGW